MLRTRARKRISRQDIYVRPLLPALLVFLAFMVIISISWHTARQDITTQQQAAVAHDSAFVESSLRQRFSIYEDSLRASRGLFLSSDSVMRNEWSEFVATLNLPSRYPGIRGLGFIKVVSAQDKDAFQQSVRDNDLSTYTIYPAGSRAEYAPLLYIVPLGSSGTTDQTSPALGYDMYSDPLRLKAMQASVKSGSPTLSSIVNLVQTSAKPASRGFLMFMPLYKKDMPITTITERQAALDGYFYAPFVNNGVFASLFTVPDSSFAFSLYDGQPTSENLLFNSDPAINMPAFMEVKRNTFSIYGQEWTAVYKIKKEIVPYTVRARPMSVVIGGSIFSAALALIIYLLIQRRTRSLAYSEQKKLEEAKDDLLSLASHQLRTPATAVKQYVSMVKEGFAGELSPEQRKLLQMAYESNERQLTIVDDLLYVARIDAGKATLKLEQVDMGELAASVVADQQSVTKTRQQKVIFKRPPKPVMVEADPQYVRMILENLLSNASKYSHEKKTISVQIRGGRDEVTASVADNGVGIKQADYGNVFLKFSRIPNELTRQTAGSGIGLYLAKQLALLHGGDLTFVSRPNKGSTFTLVLPKYGPTEQA